MIHWDDLTWRYRHDSVPRGVSRWKLVATLLGFVILMVVGWKYITIDRSHLRDREIVRSDVAAVLSNSEMFSGRGGLWAFRGDFDEAKASVLFSSRLVPAEIVETDPFFEEQKWHSNGDLAAADVPWVAVKFAVVVCGELAVCEDVADGLERSSVGPRPNAAGSSR